MPALASLVLLAGCAASPKPPALLAPKELPEGLVVELTKRGSGPVPARGQQVLVDYVATFTDGEVFDSTEFRGEPLKVTVGLGQVIEGWDEALTRLPVGSRVRMYVPSRYGYGKRGGGEVVPPDTDLVYYLEVLKIVEDK